MLPCCCARTNWVVVTLWTHLNLVNRFQFHWIRLYNSLHKSLKLNHHDQSSLLAQFKCIFIFWHHNGLLTSKVNSEHGKSYSNSNTVLTRSHSSPDADNPTITDHDYIFLAATESIIKYSAVRAPRKKLGEKMSWNLSGPFQRNPWWLFWYIFQTLPDIKAKMGKLCCTSFWVIGKT